MTDLNEESLEKPSGSLRNPWLAALMSLLATGVGQVYNGQWKKGAAFLVFELVFSLIMIMMWGDFVSMMLCVSILFGFNLFVAGEAYATARGIKSFTPGTGSRWWVYGLFIVVGLGLGSGFELVMTNCFYKTYKAPSGSMIPTLMIGDHFMVDILDDGERVKRGDIVVFKSPEDETKDFVKRVIGLPGETLEIKRKKVFVDGRELEEPYARHAMSNTVPLRDNFGPYSIPKGAYFVMGDNREGSHDSRWFGAIERDKIRGRAIYLYFPGGIGSEGWSERLGMELR